MENNKDLEYKAVCNRLIRRSADFYKSIIADIETAKQELLDLAIYDGTVWQGDIERVFNNITQKLTDEIGGRE